MVKKASVFFCGNANVPRKSELSEDETEVAKALSEIMESSTAPELKAIVGTMEFKKVLSIPVEKTSKNMTVVFVNKNQFRKAPKTEINRLVVELEKKTKRHIAIVGLYNIMLAGDWIKKHGMNKPRPYGRTITAVRNNFLQDICLPSEVTGIRTLYTTGGSKIRKIYLDPRDRLNLEEKLPSLAAAYSKFARVQAQFDFDEFVL